jgi:DNA-binding transcriptional MocR family regulator
MPNRATSGKLARSLADELGEWAVGAGPLYRQLARAVAGAVERGAFGPGTRLPAERVVAAALSISRGTAVAAFDLLVADGMIERRRGSGTFVVGAPSAGLPEDREGSALVHRLVDRSVGAGPMIDLSLSVLADAGGLPDVGLAVADLLGVSPPSGLSPWGLASLRAMLAEHVAAWGMPASADQVVVTAGAQEAVSLAAACWVRVGDTVVVDDPTYPGAIAAFRQAGARLVGVPVDAAGPRPDALRTALAAHPALVYLQSGIHSPTGAALTGRRTEELAACLGAARVPFVEDRALADLAWAPGPPPIASLLPSTSSIVVGSLSKLFWGGLRIGYVRAERPLALRLARIKATRDLGTSAVGQLVAERLMPSADAVARRRRDQLRARSAALLAAVRSAVPGVSCEQPSGGLSLWVGLPAPVAPALAVAARRHGVAVATAESLSPESAMGVASDYGVSGVAPHDDRIRLSFSGPEDELREGAARLGAAWASLGPYPDRPAGRSHR